MLVVAVSLTLMALDVPICLPTLLTSPWLSHGNVPAPLSIFQQLLAGHPGTPGRRQPVCIAATPLRALEHAPPRPGFGPCWLGVQHHHTVVGSLSGMCRLLLLSLNNR